MKITNKSQTILAILIIGIILLTACSNKQTTEQTECSSHSGSAKENCYYELKNCEAMQESEFKNSCIAELAREQNNSAMCDTLNANRSKGYCYKELAIKNQNIELCAKINDTYWKDNCYYDLGILQNKESLCYLLEPTNVRQKTDCFMKIALSEGKVKICDFLPTDQKETCIFRVAIKTTNPETCNMIQDQFSTASCIYRIAKETNNEKLCTSIKIKDAQNICASHFETQMEKIQ